MNPERPPETGEEISEWLYDKTSGLLHLWMGDSDQNPRVSACGLRRHPYQLGESLDHRCCDWCFILAGGKKSPMSLTSGTS